MSKQEVIEILAKESCSRAHIRENGHPCPPCYDIAKTTYDRIAPLMVREYPEQKILAGVNRIFNHLEAVFEVEIVGSVNMRGMLNGMFRQFWEGQPKVGDNILEQEGRYDTDKAKNRARSRVLKIAQDKPRGTCGKCGGSKRVPDYDNIDQKLGTIYIKDCPNCGGTGECQHRNIQNVQTDLISLYCDSCEQYVKDRRVRNERREGEIGRRIYDSPDNAMYGATLDRRTRARRKAASDDA